MSCHVMRFLCNISTIYQDLYLGQRYAYGYTAHGGGADYITMGGGVALSRTTLKKFLVRGVWRGDGGGVCAGSVSGKHPARGCPYDQTNRLNSQSKLNLQVGCLQLSSVEILLPQVWACLAS